MIFKTHERLLKLAVGCTAALLIAGSAAYADDDVARPGYGPGYTMGFNMGFGPRSNMGMGPMFRFQTLDQNSDGIIGDDEAAANAEGVFAAMDTDDDGEVTEDEYLAVRMGPGDGLNKARQEAMQTRKEERFLLMDTDKNGTVSQSEFLIAAKNEFEGSDTDGDGKVTPWEFRAKRQVF